ncbi:hypothetical protein CapIbe_002364 [Capra ibex]
MGAARSGAERSPATLERCRDSNFPPPPPPLSAAAAAAAAAAVITRIWKRMILLHCVSLKRKICIRCLSSSYLLPKGSLRTQITSITVKQPQFMSIFLPFYKQQSFL